MSFTLLSIKPGTLHLYIQKLLVVIILALVAITALAVVLLLAKSPPAPVMPSEDSLTWASFDADATPAAESLSIVERPLFWESRRPYVPDDAPIPEPAAPDAPQNTLLDDAKLLGVFSAGSASSVVLQKGKDKYRVSLNEDFLGWTLTSVFFDRVIFTETQTLNNDAPNLKTVVLEGREPLPSEWQGSGSISAESR